MNYREEKKRKKGKSMSITKKKWRKKSIKSEVKQLIHCRCLYSFIFESTASNSAELR